MLTRPDLLSPLFRWQEYEITLSTSPQRVLTANPARVAILWSSNSTAAYRIATRSDLSSNGGLQVNQATAPWLLKYADVGGMVCADWYIYFSGLLTQVNLVEVLFIPREG